MKAEKSHFLNDRNDAPHLRHFDRSEAKWSGVEKSPILMVHEALRQEISRLRVSWVPGSLPSILTCSSARDDGVGEQHQVISEGDEPHSRHFDRSEAKWSGVEKSPILMVHEALRQEISRLSVSWVPGALPSISVRSPARDDVGSGHPYRHFDESEAEWRNLPPPMVRAALRREIFRLRVSSKRFPSAPYRHADPLEMTVLASSIQSFQKGDEPHSRHFDESGAEWRNLTPHWHMKH